MDLNTCHYQIQTYSYKPKGKKKKSIDERIEDFKNMVRNWIKEEDPNFTRPKWMYVEFVEKYTEPTKGGRTFLYEQQKTWDTGRRLKKWEENSRQWQPKRWKEETQPAVYKPPKVTGLPHNEGLDYVAPLPDYNKAKERLKNEPKKTGHLSNLIQQNLKR